MRYNQNSPVCKVFLKDLKKSIIPVSVAYHKMKNIQTGEILELKITDDIVKSAI
ncbi:MAG: hypothetical protein DDT42_00761 [candidate division WS2 bacterium]|uniref:Uncharacterized protein n=1 Tax=Psychracetigena formicireducens TaxID=2986056 RepID=A0A9E2BFZ8_PSYF1|nr:hypothetical protein [Candidatus Psychracetigena formicireducens]MBT9144905.1 hypothetical protein [Candidatus Psychracetigena formicireducens]